MSEPPIRCPECGALNAPGAQECQACRSILLDVPPPETISAGAGATAGSSRSMPSWPPQQPPPMPYDEFEYKEQDYDASMRFILPVGRSGLAIAAGYLGLFSLIIFPAPFALLLGILAVRDLKKNPKKLGMGRAVFGIIAGTLGSLALLSMFGAMLFRR